MQWQALTSGAVRTDALTLHNLRVSSVPWRGTVLDRPLTARERRVVRQRALFHDADVLLVHPGSPLCARGVSRAELTALLSGTTNRWSQLVGFEAWEGAVPGISPDRIDRMTRARTQSIGAENVANIMFNRRSLGTSRERYPGAHIASGVVHAPWHPGIARHSDLRYTPGACAVPVDGVAPTDATVKNLTYPYAFTAYWVRTKKHAGIDRMVFRFSAQRLFGPTGRASAFS